jgi:UDP-3-O-[3-hydroxymyristoyl] glucosamine N-acyltransferase
LIGHLSIGAGARIGAQAGVARDVPAGATVAGSPAVPIIQWHRQTAVLARLVKRKRSD